MRKNIFAVVLFVAAIGALVGLSRVAVGGEQVNFSLSVGQGIRVAEYMVTFQGVSGGFPVYNLLARGGTLARFPLDPAISPASYAYGNLSITTNSLSPDGKKATGSVNIQ